MANCDVGLVTSCLCFIGSLSVLALGFLYLVLKLEQMRLEFSDCGFVQADCNWKWRGLFTLRPNVLLDVWTPIILGILGSSIHVHSMRFCFFFEWILPTNYVQYAVFMLVTALFASFGYCGQLGVIVGAFSLCTVVLCILARLTGENGIKRLQTKW
eukprot:gb/GFBE01036717.1/.p1 GENE.gb/GFBE01036717.1/~~gb/GFBE01036717.1/.p1  ORF type:complete len:156 (+),score=15.68 gb/GFBE01036717.1/:1-468(+)